MWKQRLLGVIALVVAAFGLAWYWFIASFHLSNNLVPKNTTAIVDEFGKHLQSISQKAAKGEIPSRKIDFSSVGHLEMESELLMLRHWMEVYEISEGSPPKQAIDLQRLVAGASLEAEQKKRIQNLIQDCQILMPNEDSYLLNCDGWRPKTVYDIQEFITRFDLETEKFYIQSDHVFLYGPAPIRNLKH